MRKIIGDKFYDTERCTFLLNIYRENVPTMNDKINIYQDLMIINKGTYLIYSKSDQSEWITLLNELDAKKWVLDFFTIDDYLKVWPNTEEG